MQETEAVKRAKRKYEQKIKNYTVKFNVENDDDLKCLEILNRQENKNQFIKKLILKEHRE